MFSWIAVVMFMLRPNDPSTLGLIVCGVFMESNCFTKSVCLPLHDEHNRLPVVI